MLPTLRRSHINPNPLRPEGESEYLARELQRTRSQVRRMWPMPELLPQEADVLFCDLGPGLPGRLPAVPGATKAALAVLIPSMPPPDLDLLKKVTQPRTKAGSAPVSLRSSSPAPKIFR
ncbi:MAG: hypothetical protein ACREFJ_07090 [Acetobacteraceae bacterium]